MPDTEEKAMTHHDHHDGVPHNHDRHHPHDHTHDHGHDHGHDHPHHHGGHDALLKSPAEVAKFLQYTLQHNAHHAEELDGLAHSLDHLTRPDEAGEIRACIAELKKVDSRLEALLKKLS
jgi:ABC-type Zn2+ transport system substrate-binding protein/surface adhesin